MRYGEVITRSVHIFWNHRYLWLLGALGGGEAVGGGGGGGGGGNFGNFGSNSNSAQPGEFFRQVGLWIVDHLALLIGLGLVLFVIFWAYFLVSCIASGALIRAAAEHDAERPFGLGPAWRAGRRTFWSILGVRLLYLLYALLLAAVAGVLVFLAVLSGISHNGGGVAAVIVLGVMFALLLIPVGIALGLVYILALRAIVLEQMGAIAGLRRGWQLVRRRLGRVLLSWLIQVGIAFLLAIGLGIVLLILLVPVIGIVVTAYSAGGVGAALGTGIVVFPVYLVLAVVAGGAVGSYVGIYWTLAFRRLDLDPVPVASPA
jgi:hypothetical protein